MDKTEVQQSVKQTKQGRRAERRQENQRREQERKKAAKRRRLITMTSVAIVVVVVIAFGLFTVLNNRENSSTASAGAASLDTSHSVAPVVDNIACEVSEQTVYHIHAHVSIYINGQLQALPANIGINEQQGCFYWMHTHDTTGVIHIESPQPVTYTLGNFFDIWSQQFSQLQYPIELDQTSGWQAYVDGKPYTGDFHKIQLNAHALITLAYNSPNAPVDKVYNWTGL